MPCGNADVKKNVCLSEKAIKRAAKNTNAKIKSNEFELIRINAHGEGRLLRWLFTFFSWKLVCSKITIKEQSKKWNMFKIGPDVSVWRRSVSMDVSARANAPIADAVRSISDVFHYFVLFTLCGFFPFICSLLWSNLFLFGYACALLFIGIFRLLGSVWCVCNGPMYSHPTFIVLSLIITIFLWFISFKLILFSSLNNYMIQPPVHRSCSISGPRENNCSNISVCNCFSVSFFKRIAGRVLMSLFWLQ